MVVVEPESLFTPKKVFTFLCLSCACTCVNFNQSHYLRSFQSKNKNLKDAFYMLLKVLKWCSFITCNSFIDLSVFSRRFSGKDDIKLFHLLSKWLKNGEWLLKWLQKLNMLSITLFFEEMVTDRVILPPGGNIKTSLLMRVVNINVHTRGHCRKGVPV